MRLIIGTLTVFLSTTSYAADQIPLQPATTTTATANHTIPEPLFSSLSELSQLVDISYCITPANLGISQPFTCLSRCAAFPSFTLVTTWNTGPLLSDSCGYIALDDSPADPRIVLAFRGTYSMANTVLDLATVPQEYVPYPARGGGEGEKCRGCTVHMGFARAWELTDAIVTPRLAALRVTYPRHRLVLVGHSLGGAVAALAALDFEAKSWRPEVTTFGEPRVGNAEWVGFLDAKFGLVGAGGSRYRRVTHRDDPVPLLPLSEWGYKSHAGEIFIDKKELEPERGDVRYCDGDEDLACSAGQDESLKHVLASPVDGNEDTNLSQAITEMVRQSVRGLGFPTRFKLWQLLFAHRDYFWRLGLCVPDVRHQT